MPWSPYRAYRVSPFSCGTLKLGFEMTRILKLHAVFLILLVLSTIKTGRGCRCSLSISRHLTFESGDVSTCRNPRSKCFAALDDYNGLRYKASHLNLAGDNDPGHFTHSSRQSINQATLLRVYLSVYIEVHHGSPSP